MKLTPNTPSMTWFEACEAMSAGHSVRRPNWNHWITWGIRNGQIVQLGGIEYACVPANTKDAHHHHDWEVV